MLRSKRMPLKRCFASPCRACSGSDDSFSIAAGCGGYGSTPFHPVRFHQPIVRHDDFFLIHFWQSKHLMVDHVRITFGCSMQRLFFLPHSGASHALIKTCRLPVPMTTPEAFPGEFSVSHGVVELALPAILHEPYERRRFVPYALKTYPLVSPRR